MPTIAHISDLHLQSGKPKRQAQVEPILKKINEMKPDLVVISGDVTDDGWDSIDELKWAKYWLDVNINPKWIAIPGNHDVGNFVTLDKGQIDSDREANWRKVFGDNPVEVFGLWTVFGLNSMLFGSGLHEEKQQIIKLANELTYVRESSGYVAVFQHSPMIIKHIEEKDPAVDYWIGPRAGRQTAIQTFVNLECPIGLLGTGHVHQSSMEVVDNILIAWAPPASGTWVHAPGLPNPPMPEQTGFFLHTLHDDGRVETELIECAPMLKLYEHNPWP